GNPDISSISVGLDQISPLIDTVGKHGKGWFVNGDTAVERVLEDQNINEALQIETSRIDLNGAGINRQSLDENGIPFFAFSVSDPEDDDVFSSFDELAVSYQYKINDNIISDWTPLPPVENEYLVPLVSKGLHAEWYKASPLDQHIVNIGVADKAGNVSNRKFNFRADFRLPEIHIPDENIEEDKNSVDMFAQYDFSKRSELNNRTFSAVRYKYNNDTGHAIYIKPEDDEQHKVVRSYDEAVRENKMIWTVTPQWRISKITNALLTSECPKAADGTQVIVSELYNRTEGGWNKEVPVSVVSEPISVKTDSIEETVTGWEEFHFDTVVESANVYIPTDKPGVSQTLTYSYDYILSLPEFSTPAMIADWKISEPDINGNPVIIKTCESVSYLEVMFTTTVASTIDENGEQYPINRRKDIQQSAPELFFTSGFIVNDIEVGDITPLNGWYRIPAGHSVLIHKLVDTPDIENYTSDEIVEDLKSIRSYNPLKYDKEIMWRVKQKINISAVHDAGIENIDKMNQKELIVRGSEEDVSVFAISR
ncbi:MAG: hypothetical protein OEX19_03805, partial [Gammaproteobacteria bacterium]|nr:hypothetical protein [Gammaproteobacteria bacterium]